MEPTITPIIEKERIFELRHSDIINTPEEDFDDVVKLASQFCKTPIAAIALSEQSRHITKAIVGPKNFPEDHSVSFYPYTIISDGLFEVEDALKDVRFKNDPIVTGLPYLRFFAGMPLVTSAGNKIGVLCVMDTIARSLSQEQYFALRVLSRQTVKLLELKLLNRHSKHTTEVQQRIISVMSHDIRSPLNSIKMFLDLGKKEIFTQVETDTMLSVFDANVSRTIQLLNNLVEWSKLQLQFTKRREFLSLYDLIQECIEQAELNIILKHNKIINEVDQSVFVDSDREAIQFILRNLISNANKFTENGVIKISSFSKEPCKVFLCVEDSGVGIEMSKVDEILEEKSNYHTEGTQHEKGSGLGLSLIKTYLDQTGNELKIKSFPHSGTSVSFSISACE